MMWLRGSKNKYGAFWEWFAKKEPAYFELAEAAREREMNELYKRLQKINKHLTFEFSQELIEGRREFIISADGMVEAFDDVLNLVDAEPGLERFRILPFRQPSPEEFSVAYGDLELSFDDLFFEAVMNEAIDVVIYARGFTEAEEDGYAGAIFLLLDGLLGEFTVGTRLGDIQFKRYEGQPEARPFAELADLLEEGSPPDLSFLPPTLQKLKAYDEQLQERGESLEEGIGVRWTDASMAYHNTPLDVLPFLDMGVDGIHFGLLTDFGNVKDLEEAYVVLIMPADPESSCFVARNAKEFVGYLCSDQYLTVGYNGAVFGSPDEYRQAIADADKDFEVNPDLDNAWQRAAADLREAMDAEPIADVYRYVFETVPAARNAVTALSTLDGIGVVAGAGEEPERFEVDADGAPELAAVQAFFATASEAGKFAAIRNLQFTMALFEDEELKEFIIEELEAMGCRNEAERLRMMDW